MGSDRFARHVLSTDDVDPRSRMDYWRGALSDSIVAFESRFDHAAFAGTRSLGARVTKGEVGAISIVDISGPAGDVRRTSGLIRRSDPGLLNLYVQVSGRSVIEQAGRQAALGPGDSVLLDLSRPGRWIAEGRQGINLVMFPRSLLTLPSAKASELTAVTLPGREGTGSLLATVAGQLAGRMDDEAVAGNLALATAMVDLISAAVAVRSGDTPPISDTGRGARLLRIKAYIDHRLNDRTLTVASIAAAHHVSVRTLQKLFQSENTTASGWIRDRRLERCRRDLLDPGQHNRSAAAIGARWGFVDATHFGRAFRARYGLPPGDYRATARTRPDHRPRTTE